MLQALDKEGKSVIPAQLTHEEISFLKSNNSFVCPVCREDVILKAGNKVLAHFAHLPNSNCASSKNGETLYHERGKLDLYQWLVRQRIPAKLEVYLPDIKQRPDLLIQLNKKQIAIEYQCVRMSEQEFIDRNNGYKSLHITPIWVLGGNRMKRIGHHQLSLDSYDTLFIHQYHSTTPTTVYYYCPNSKQFAVFQHLYASGRKKTFGSLHFYPLNDILFKQLFYDHPFPNKDICSDWTKEKYTYRTRYQPKVSAQEAYWRRSLYIKGLHPSLLPAIIHLPNPYQYLMKTPPWVWQSDLYLNILLNFQTCSLSLCERYIKKYEKPSSYPLIFIHPKPVLHYLNLLITLGYLIQLDSSNYSLVRQAEFPKTIEYGMEQDHLIMQQLFSSPIKTHEY
ncbi:competence protein CoiA [Aquibacillus salsiterrae]|uniref:Competence protein CoiA n=1 Tax=Aquibacillus salsiterrae TaxID=2950439 RepID=A0A9X3WGV7_9BACI|nr:competence protein CoiA family protein [Aquibacillus salsiterrae]MDC3417199.1 competence protein CoiA [Aquibacillus salsiterrae]